MALKTDEVARDTAERTGGRGRSGVRALVLWVPLLVLVAACSSASDDAPAVGDPATGTEAATASAPDAASATDATASEPSIETATGLGVSNARMALPGVLTGGQLTPEQLEALSDAGYGTFISLRPVAESGAGWEEAHTQRHPHAFGRVPVSGAADLTRANVEAFAKLLEAAGGEPAVVYCASGNRAGAMLALKAHWIDGVAAAEAYRLGLDAGLKGLAPTVSELLGLQAGA